MSIRIVTNFKADNATDVARTLRSLAAKLDAGALVPGADFKVGEARVQVAEKTESPERAFARKFGFPVGARGRFSPEVLHAFEIYNTAPDKRKVISQVKALAAEARA